ncbi:hypothetical protein MBLNU230_g0305t1 [Neophaeotheca triangularis]
MASPNETASAGPKLLDPSKLGTKEYWDDIYAREVTNFTHDANDEGEVWFDDSDAENVVIKELEALEEEGVLSKLVSRFLDLGTGNGHMLFELREREASTDEPEDCWLGEMVGVDYSEASVELARRIGVARELMSEGDGDAGAGAITFEQWDLLSAEPGAWLGNGFDVVLDKGTFDAISLMPRSESGHHPCEVYRDKVVPLIKLGCYLIVTSCNWTKQELIQWLVGDGAGGLEYVKEGHYREFSFGGQKGQTVVTLVFRRRQ